MSLKKAAVAAVAATMIFTGSNAVAQETSSDVDQQSSQVQNSESSTNENASAEAGSTEVQDFYNENRDIIRPILITLAVLQGVALIAGPIRTLIYNVARV